VGRGQLAGVDDAHDAGVVERAEDVGLEGEAPRHGLGDLLAVQQLDGHVAAQAFLPRPQHEARGPRAEHVDDLAVAQAARHAGGQGVAVGQARAGRAVVLREGAVHVEQARHEGLEGVVAGAGMAHVVGAPGRVELDGRAEDRVGPVVARALHQLGPRAFGSSARRWPSQARAMRQSLLTVRGETPRVAATSTT